MIVAECSSADILGLVHSMSSKKKTNMKFYMKSRFLASLEKLEELVALGSHFHRAEITIRCPF